MIRVKDCGRGKSSSDEVIGRAIARRGRVIAIEGAALHTLPARRTTDHDEVLVTVTRSGGFILRRVFYILPSRLIGHRLRVRLYDNRLECLLGGTLVVILAPIRASTAESHLHVVDYHHVTHTLRHKPAALLNLVYRDQWFPREAYRRMAGGSRAATDRLPRDGQLASAGA